MKDGVYPIVFHGSHAYEIVWSGQKLAMVWGDRSEAVRHLWLLRNPAMRDRVLNGFYLAELPRRQFKIPPSKLRMSPYARC